MKDLIKSLSKGQKLATLAIVATTATAMIRQPKTVATRAAIIGLSFAAGELVAKNTDNAETSTKARIATAFAGMLVSEKVAPMALKDGAKNLIGGALITAIGAGAMVLDEYLETKAKEEAKAEEKAEAKNFNGIKEAK